MPRRRIAAQSIIVINKLRFVIKTDFFRNFAIRVVCENFHQKDSLSENEDDNKKQD